ncbi:MAG: hypothetical protein MUF65_12465 [Rubritepida sp.]|jgi:hypothetical protein|nr:hypothetical protein [Rubritepida sp.]MCU0946166.1 hypothetical protein [Rubritepida sp.]
MPASSFFFLVMAALITLTGLFAITVAEGYFYAWSLMLTGFGLFYGYGIVKRHYDAKDAARH